MTIGIGSLVEVTLNMTVLGNQNLNVFQYLANAAPPLVMAVHIAEAWWNNVKAVYRALPAPAQGNVFKTVRIRELNNPSGDYAEYDIPLAEQVGLRGGSPGDIMPPFVAAGIRLVVGTRVTRPGQKRLPFVYEADSVSGIMQAALLTLVTTWANTMTVDMALGAPAATAALRPIITRKDANGTVVANQTITGYLINQNISSQNTRKYGRGA